MPLLSIPARDKLWRTVTGNTVMQAGASGAAQAASAFVTATQLMLAASAPGVSCSGSSNSVAANLTGTNLVLNPATDVVPNAAGVHTWMVLKLDALGCQVCFDFNAASNWLMTIVWSPGGLFTGGSTTARPTAVDQIVNRSGFDWLIGNNTAKMNISFWMSEDGKNAIVKFVCGAVDVGTWMWGVLGNPRAGWTQPYYLYVDAATAPANVSLMTPLRVTQPISQATFTSKGPTNAAILHRCTYPNTGVGALSGGGIHWQSTKNTLTGMYDVFRMSLNNVTAPDRGTNGQLIDLLYGSPGMANGDICQDPKFPSRVAIQLGFFLLPWPNNSIWAV